MTRFAKSAAALALIAGLAACSTEKVVDRSVDTGLFATRTLVKTGVGAGKVVVKGGGAVVRRASGN
ncbi:hypothetical protein [Jannaschia ovalis]|uniref:Uncharacterized protein n=1 Tax=Jannaschia ovalis TaxID=3038773 RepID=A0ABY8L8B8_9RHOB|nr:hypothetical protein [Jannaschia sp. GRR-S6-38]WGH77607.1 hypothetical protein P8627_11220 [Jannaschia sp. GRR-S6-38]